MADVLCTEGVIREDAYDLCGKPAVARRIDPECGLPYPVCVRHTRAKMVTLQQGDDDA